MDDEPLGTIGLVPVSARGSLPFLLLHGESLVAAASWALEAAEVPLADYRASLADLQASGRVVVLHDPLCPLTPPAFIADAVRQASERGVVVVGVRPVTDTVKETAADLLGRTHDRSDLLRVLSPVVLPAAVVAGLTELPADFGALVELLGTRVPVSFVEAPASASRIVEPDDVAVLEAMAG